MTYHVPDRPTKGFELIKRLNAITCADEANDFALQGIKREAQALMAADPVGAHTALGMVAVLQGRIDDVRRHYCIALQQSGHSAQAYRNYSASLMNLGEMIEAFEAAREAVRRAPDDGGALRHLILVALGSAHFREARDHCDRWNTLFPGGSVAARSAGEGVGRRGRTRSVPRGVGAESPAHRARCSACGKSRPACCKNRPGGRQRTRFVPLQAPHSVVARLCGRSQ